MKHLLEVKFKGILNVAIARGISLLTINALFIKFHYQLGLLPKNKNDSIEDPKKLFEKIRTRQKKSLHAQSETVLVCGIRKERHDRLLDRRLYCKNTQPNYSRKRLDSTVLGVA